MSEKPADKRSTRPTATPPKKRPAEALGKKASRDMVLVHGFEPEREQYHVLRARDDRVEAGVMTPVREGEAIEGEVVRLKPREEMPLLCDVEVQLPDGAVNARGGSDSDGARTGPAKVSTRAYRSNWDSIWKRPRSRSLPN